MPEKMINLNKSIINPFDYINSEKIRDKVNKLKDLHPEWEKEELCRELVKQKCYICGGTGAISALPSSLPGLGTFITIAGGTAIDITTMVYFLSELTLEIATVYNREPSTEATTREALWVLSSCFGTEAAVLGISKVTVINASKKAFAVIIRKLLTIIGGWIGKRLILKTIPILGSILNATINVNACKHVGKETVLWYKTNLEQDPMWTKSPAPDEDIEEEEEEIKPKDDVPDENIILEPMEEATPEEDIEEEYSDIKISVPEEEKSSPQNNELKKEEDIEEAIIKEVTPLDTEIVKDKTEDNVPEDKISEDKVPDNPVDDIKNKEEINMKQEGEK